MSVPSMDVEASVDEALEVPVVEPGDDVEAGSLVDGLPVVSPVELVLDGAVVVLDPSVELEVPVVVVPVAVVPTVDVLLSVSVPFGFVSDAVRLTSCGQAARTSRAEEARRTRRGGMTTPVGMCGLAQSTFSGPTSVVGSIVVNFRIRSHSTERSKSSLSPAFFMSSWPSPTKKGFFQVALAVTLNFLCAIA